MSQEQEVTIYSIMQTTADEMCRGYCKWGAAAEEQKKNYPGENFQDELLFHCRTCPLTRWF